MPANSSCGHVAISATFLSTGIAQGVNASGCQNRYHWRMEQPPKLENRIREVRVAKGMTQEQLAVACGADKTQISRLENSANQLTQPWMHRLAKALACAPAELLPLSDFPASEAELLSQFRRMTKAEQDQLNRLAVALAPPQTATPDKAA